MRRCLAWSISLTALQSEKSLLSICAPSAEPNELYRARYDLDVYAVVGGIPIFQIFINHLKKSDKAPKNPRLEGAEAACSIR